MVFLALQTPQNMSSACFGSLSGSFSAFEPAAIKHPTYPLILSTLTPHPVDAVHSAVRSSQAARVADRKLFPVMAMALGPGAWNPLPHGSLPPLRPRAAARPAAGASFTTRHVAAALVAAQGVRVAWRESESVG